MKIKILMWVAVFLFLVFGLPCFAQSELPDKPQPRTANAEYWAEVGIMGAAWTADTVSTHQWMVESPRHYEAGDFFTGSRSTPKIMAAWAAVDVAAAVVAYEWKGHVHNRFLHPLWRVPMMVRAEAHSEGFIHNWTN